MRVSARGMSSLVIALGVILLLGAQPSALAKKNPRISVGDDPSAKKGSPELVLVEIADFQCPDCREGARTVLSPVFALFVPNGKVEIVFLDFPLPLHPHAFKAAEAAACAGDQKMFWEMHNQLFANQQALAPDRLPGHASDVGLDIAAFQKCLDSGRHAAGIREDIRTVQNLGITGTPAYLLGRRLPDSDKIEILDVIKGLPPYGEMNAKIGALLPPPPYALRARAAFPDVKRRFVQGLPEGSELRIAAKQVQMIVVDKIEGKSITGHWFEGMTRHSSQRQQIYTISEEDILDWALIRPDGVTEGNFDPSSFMGRFYDMSQWATGTDCDQAERAVKTPPLDEAKRACKEMGAHLCRTDYGILFECRWDEASRMYRVYANGSYACCA